MTELMKEVEYNTGTCTRHYAKNNGVRLDVKSFFSIHWWECPQPRKGVQLSDLYHYGRPVLKSENNRSFEDKYVNVHSA